MDENRKKRELLILPQYANPSIAEALCEIHFTTKTENFDKSIKEISKLFKPAYQDPQEKKTKQYRATINDVGFTIEANPASFYVFKHNKRDHLIQISPYMIAINEIGKYPGWETFSGDLSFAWESIQKAFSISSIKHIGLRYINLIPRKNADEPLSQWLQPNRYYPDGILDSTSGFVSRSEFNIELSKRLIVTIAEATQNKGENGFIFDIDTVTQINENIQWESILKRIDALHEIVSDVFSTSIAKKYESFLKGENL